MSEQQLPLTEVCADHRRINAIREAEVSEAVERFYALGRADALLGPVFEARVADWDAHLKTMCNFWMSAIYRTGRYSGRPLEVHRSIEGLSRRHFDRWLGLWEQSVQATVQSPAVRALMTDLAVRMAWTMSSRLDLADN